MNSTAVNGQAAVVQSELSNTQEDEAYLAAFIYMTYNLERSWVWGLEDTNSCERHEKKKDK